MTNLYAKEVELLNSWINYYEQLMNEGPKQLEKKATKWKVVEITVAEI